MKTKLTAFTLFLLFAASVAVVAGPDRSKGSHPGEQSNGIGSTRFPNHYAGPSHPQHP